MRLRKKKYLQERVDAVAENLVGKDCYGFYKLEDKSSYMLNYNKIFSSGKEVHLEIGCGKADFLLEKSADFKNVNFIGVEKLINVLVDALERVPSGIKNLKFLNIDAQNVEHFIPSGSVQKIYLNFSCPYPKKQYANHRLTNSKFLEIYKKICVPNFTIEQKTDNDTFFEYSLQEYEKSGFEIVKITRDLHEEKDFSEEKKYLTQYEKKFMSLGKNINFVKVRYKG